MDLKALIKEKKPNITDSSIQSYYSSLTCLHKKIWNEATEFKVDDFNDASKVLDYMKDLSPQTRKTKLSAIKTIVSNPLYDEQMEKDVEAHKQIVSKQEKTEKDIASNVEQEEIKKLYDSLKFEADHLYKKEHHTILDLQNIQNCLIIGLCGGVLMNPRRSKDWTDFKIKNIDKEKDNYLDKDELVFNSYKNGNKKGQQREKITVQVKNLLKKWIKLNPTDFLMFDTNYNQLSSPKMTQRLNKLFGDKKISINALRHSFLEDKFGHTIQLNKDINNTMESMGSSIASLPYYVKMDTGAAIPDTPK